MGIATTVVVANRELAKLRLLEVVLQKEMPPELGDKSARGPSFGHYLTSPSLPDRVAFTPKCCSTTALSVAGRRR